MLLIKPYGRSYTEVDADKSTRRTLRLKPDYTQQRHIQDFATQNPSIVIAQWISIVDKIATKPHGNKCATKEQKNLRQKLGHACLEEINKRNLIQGNGSEYEKVWWAKIHPYTDKIEAKKNPSPKGRWYSRFAGDVCPDKIDAKAIAKKIHKHLYEAEYRLSSDAKPKRQGLIKARIKSIEQNYLKPINLDDFTKTEWSDANEEAYLQKGDVATQVLQAFQENPQENEKQKKYKSAISFSYRDIAPIFSMQYSKIFTDSHGNTLPIKEAKSQHPELFALHQSIKDTYKSLLQNRQKKNRKNIPCNWSELIALLKQKRRNKDINALIRLGKVIHYEASYQAVGPSQDSPCYLDHNWPTDISTSTYWTSVGQEEIKRNEAFVRVWRHVIAMATRTAKYWADPQNNITNDITGTTQINRVCGNNHFTSDQYRQKLPLLFGKQATLFQGTETQEKNLLRSTLTSVQTLRNSAFHFKGRGAFIDELKKLSTNDETHNALSTLYLQDKNERDQRLLETLRGGHTEFFFAQNQLDHLVTILLSATATKVTLPRLRRVLQRVENNWRKGGQKIHLPAPGNRQALENPANHCRYITLKLIYEKCFGNWLQQQSAETINKYIKRSVDHTTNSAQKINNDKDAVARSAHLIELQDGETVEQFFYRLSGLTATEMRVQRAYDSDPENARKQSAYIENLKCDVIAQAFEAYLSSSDLKFVTAIQPQNELPSDAISVLPIPQTTTPSSVSWQCTLYLFLHLVPVEDVGKLLHQIKKWVVLSNRYSGKENCDADLKTKEKPDIDIACLLDVFSLYLDMHDAKFEGGDGLELHAPLQELFESKHLFETILPATFTSQTTDLVPRRGGREMLRFGNLTYLKDVLLTTKITQQMYDDREAYLKTEDGKTHIAILQNQKEVLHEKWAKKNNSFSSENKKEYAQTLSKIITYRRLTNHVMLINHVRVHRLLMTVLGRLTDYSGIWERDLYFTFLALNYLYGTKPDETLSQSGIQQLRNGQIVATLGNYNDTKLFAEMRDILNSFFDVDNKRKLRNNFAHFNMLTGTGDGVELTKHINEARELMRYDRKLKNAVSKSIIELLQREGIRLEWHMKADHQLYDARLTSRQIHHLGDKKIAENLQDTIYVEMIAQLFNGSKKDIEDITQKDINEIKGNDNSKKSKRRGSNQKKPRTSNRNRPNKSRNPRSK